MRDLAISNAHPRLKLDRRAIKRTIALLDAEFHYTAADLPHLTPAARARAKSNIENPPSEVHPAAPAGELSLVFLTDEAITQLHADFLDDPTPTDVITFEGDPQFGTAGEICVSADTAAAYAQAHRTEFDRELTLYVVHGWLHLAGYDDLAPAKKRRMRAAEKRAMDLLDEHGCKCGFILKPR